MAKKKRKSEKSSAKPADSSTPADPKKTAKPRKEESRLLQREGFPVVGIGASAGGLDALRRLLEAMPDEPGIALVIIQHLDPTKKSLAPELLSKYTNMKVTQVVDDPHVKPNRVYVIPPNRFLSISNSELHLSEPDQPRGSRMAIDFFLRSLAEDQKQCAVGVILSGTGADGTLGVKAIKAVGGLVIVQDPSTAGHGGMPRSAIETRVPDHILAPETIPGILVRYARHPYVREGIAAATEDETGKPAHTQEQYTNGLQNILALLRAQAKHDFRNYKENTLIRRTRRRMCLHHLEDYGQYFEYLREHPQEVDALIKDLLISVTDFFRDQQPWEELAEVVIPPIVESKTTQDTIRVWVPGCATGEEAYSVAMLFLEELQKQVKTCPLQVFASDIDRDALSYGRNGRYPQAIEADVSAERLKRFFVQQKEDSNYYQVSKPLREAVVFAEQNLISDPPFSKLDLICCRNLLIYLKLEIQDKVLRLFHFALQQNRYLFLGTCETIGRRNELFDTVSCGSRIYRCKGPTRHDLVEIPISSEAPRREVQPAKSPGESKQLRVAHHAQQTLLDVLSPSAVVVNRDWEILYISGDVDPYLKHVPGEPTNDVLEKARRGLRTKLRGTIHRVLSEKKPVTSTTQIQYEGKYHPVRLEVRPLVISDTEEELALVVFKKDEQQSESPAGSHQIKEGEAPSEPAQEDKTPVQPILRKDGTFSEQLEESDLDDHTIIRQLEAELATTQEELQTTIEQYETSNEEYKASNEEVMSINEELQSTNEELETSKEELQSLNEELSTVNSQLASKVQELETKHDDMVNLLEVSHLATICLNYDLSLRWFSEQAAELIRITDSDIGRPISDFAHEFLDSDIAEVAQQVLDKLTWEEREVSAKNDRWFIRRTTPYRTEDNRIGGVVISFVDITERKKAENALREAHGLSEKIIDTVREATLVLDSDYKVMQANQAFYRTFEVSHQETLGRNLFELGNGQWKIPELQRLLNNVLPSNKIFSNYEVDYHFENIGRRIMLVNGRRIDHIQMILLAIEDITELRLAEHRRGFLLELTDTFRNSSQPHEILNQATTQLCRILHCSRTFFLQISGKGEPNRRATLVSQHSEGVEDLSENFPLFELGSDIMNCLDRNEDFVVEDIYQDPRLKGNAPDILGDLNLNSLVAVPRLDGEQVQLLLVAARKSRRKWNREEVALIRDVSERTWAARDAALAEQELSDSEERLRLAAEATGFGTYDYNIEKGEAYWSDQLAAINGYQGPMPVPQDKIIEIVHPEDREQFAKLVQLANDPKAPGRHEAEFRVVRPNGEIRWVRDVGQTHFEGEGDSRTAVRVVGTIQDITERKQVEENLRQSEERLRQAASAANFGSYSYDFETGESYWSPELCAIHGLSPNEPINLKRIEEFIHPEDRKRFQDYIAQAIETPADKEYADEFRIIRRDGQKRWIADRGRVIFGGPVRNRRPLWAAGMIVDITERKQAEEEMSKLNQQLEEQVSQRTEMLRILQDITRSANEARTVKEAMLKALQRISMYNGWQVGHVWQLADDGSHMVSSGIWYHSENAKYAIEHLEEFQQICHQTRFSLGEGLIGQVWESAQPHWIDDISEFPDWQRGSAKELGITAVIAFPVMVNNKVTTVLEFFSDRPTKREARFMEIMPDVGIQLGHVIERKQLEQEIDAAITEQMRYFAQELHDSVAQQLTGTAMMSEVLFENLKEQESDHTGVLETLAKTLRETQNQVRLLSHGLMPVEVDAEGLMQALRKLVEDSAKIYQIGFHFHCEQPVTMENNSIATHLYRITQEAIQNAVKHGDPTQIDVRLEQENGEVVLQIQDNGSGFASDPRSAGNKGFRIMDHRASLIGAQLKIQSQENNGVTITCRLRQPNGMIG